MPTQCFTLDAAFSYHEMNNGFFTDRRSCNAVVSAIEFKMIYGTKDLLETC